MADGEGRNSVWLAEQGLNVTSFDLAPTAVEPARALAARSNVELQTSVSSWDQCDWSQQFDLVVAIFIQFADPKERVRQFQNLGDAVKPGGRLLLHGYTPEQLHFGTGGPPTAENMYTAELLASEFRGWQVMRLAAYEREVQEGRGHSGHSALIDLIADKPMWGTRDSRKVTQAAPGQHPSWRDKLRHGAPGSHID